MKGLRALLGRGEPEVDDADDTPDMLDTMSALISASLDLNTHLEGN